MKLSTRAGALTPVASTYDVNPLSLLIFLQTFRRNRATGGECHFRGYLVGLSELHLLIPSIGTCLGFVRMVIMIPVLVG